jgi:hypothetical protein
MPLLLHRGSSMSGVYVDTAEQHVRLCRIKQLLKLIFNLFYFVMEYLADRVILSYSEELDGPAVSALRCAIAEVKQRW